MKETIDLNQTQLDDLATKANELSDWLQEENKQKPNALWLKIPPRLMSIAWTVWLTAPLAIYRFNTEIVPDGYDCWGGCQGGGG